MIKQVSQRLYISGGGHELAICMLLVGTALSSTASAAENRNVATPVADAENTDASAERNEIIVTSKQRQNAVSPTTLSVQPTAGIAAVYTLNQHDISGLAISTTNDLLRAIPGVQVADLGNGGIPNGVTIRGWGLVSDGVAVRGVVDSDTRNFVSGPNSNGSDDLNILIPEVIGSVNVIKGPFDTRYSGNFAYAGTAIFTTADSAPNRASVSYGSFDHKRLLATFGQGNDDDPTKFYVALDAMSESGRRDNNSQDKFNLLSKLTTQISSKDQLKITAQLYSNVYGQPGYIRTDLIESGQIGETSATDPNAKGWRRSGTLTAEWFHRDQTFNFDANFWLERETDYRSINRQDLGVVNSFPENAVNNRLWTSGLGINPWVNFAVAGIDAIFRAGAEIRGDFATVNRGPAFANVFVPQPTQLDAWTGFFSYANFTVWNPDLYGELSLKPAPWVKITVGVRDDWFNYDANVTYYPGTATGPVVPLTNVKFNTWSSKPTLHGGLAVTPGAGLTVLANFGEGISSQNVNNVALWRNPYLQPTKLNTKEVVLKYDNDKLGLNLQGGVYSTLNQGELGTDPATGLQINLGKSIRKGIDVDGRLRVYDRHGTSLKIGGNYNYLDARLTGGINPGNTFITSTPSWTAGWNLDAAIPVAGNDQKVRLSVQQNFVGRIYLTTGPVNGTGQPLTDNDYNRLAFKLQYERPSLRNLRVYVSGIAYSGDRFAEMSTTAVGWFSNTYTVKGRTYRVSNPQAPFRAEGGIAIDF
ncbi:MAG: hypothetical protein JWO15_373 [Sphingomonadales bacterium]|nr:hypothetical protein [Sphingomonadales bacterium]